MPMLVILTGAPGSGKTAVATLLSRALPNGAHIESDLFYGFFAHPVAPHLAAAHQQNAAAVSAAMQAAAALCANGYSVVLDGIFGPWFLPLLAQVRGRARLDVRYVVLQTSLDEARERVRRRAKPIDPGIVDAMHPQFADLGPLACHAFASSEAPAQLAQQLQARLADGHFRLGPMGARGPRSPQPAPSAPQASSTPR